MRDAELDPTRGAEEESWIRKFDSRRSAEMESGGGVSFRTPPRVEFRIPHSSSALRIGPNLATRL